MSPDPSTPPPPGPASTLPDASAAAARAAYRVLHPVQDRARVAELLGRTVPGDYLLGILDRWLAGGQVLGGFSGDQLVAVERLDDLGHGEGWLGGMRVVPERRREGWGRRLTSFAFEASRARGIGVVRLTIESSNVASRALSSSLGFRPVAHIAHAVGRAEPDPSATPATVRPLADVPPEVADGGDLAGVRAMGGLMLTTVPRPFGMRFARPRRARLEAEAAGGRLFLLGDDVDRGLFLLSPAEEAAVREGHRLQLLVPLGSDMPGIFQAASALATPFQSELEGFMPAEAPARTLLERMGWSTGPKAFWGQDAHVYEVRL